MVSLISSSIVWKLLEKKIQFNNRWNLDRRHRICVSFIDDLIIAVKVSVLLTFFLLLLYNLSDTCAGYNFNFQVRYFYVSVNIGFIFFIFYVCWMKGYIVLCFRFPFPVCKGTLSITLEKCTPMFVVLKFSLEFYL